MKFTRMVSIWSSRGISLLISRHLNKKVSKNYYSELLDVVDRMFVDAFPEDREVLGYKTCRDAFLLFWSLEIPAGL
jgi:hypothetical protein